MDTIECLQKGPDTIKCIDMHTAGEPTRILIHHPLQLEGTLLQQRAQAQSKYDHIRRRVMLEPTGHADMYGAVLCPDTELTNSGRAHMGVLFCHNEGWSTMCGHATIALGRLLIDTQDESVFPRRKQLAQQEGTSVVKLNLHAPCGLVEVDVPVGKDGKSDPARPVSFLNVPSFASGKDINIPIPQGKRWPELKDRDSVTASFCYGGGFTCLVSTKELGFGQSGLKQPIDLEAYNLATRNLKEVIQWNKSYAKYMRHPEIDDVGFLYTLLVVDKTIGAPAPGTKGAETGLCYFANQQIDRSPTGSATAARAALAYAAGGLKMNESWTYHSLVTNAMDRADGKGGFVAKVVQEVAEMYDQAIMLSVPVRIQVKGYGYYLGSHVFIAEEEDKLGRKGFLFNRSE